MATRQTSDKIQKEEAVLKPLLTSRDTKKIRTQTRAQIYTLLIAL